MEDDQEHAQSRGTRVQRDVDDFDAMYGVERSFRLIFPNNQEIAFFADTDDEKVKWYVSLFLPPFWPSILTTASYIRLEVFRALVGHIPPNPLWAELVWQRQNEQGKVQSPTLSTGADESHRVR